MINDGSFLESALQTVIAWHFRFDVRQGGRAFIAEQKFQLAELNRLKPGSGVEAVAKGVIVSRMSIWPTSVFMIVRVRLKE